MNLIIEQTQQLAGHATPPSSKSQSIRAIFLATLSRGTSVLHNILDSADTRDAIRVCAQLGADVSITADTLSITSPGFPLARASNHIHTGNSGITTHFVMPLLGLRDNCAQPVQLTCDAQMQARPIAPLVNALTQVGMHIDYLTNSTRLPIRITGTLRGGQARVAGITSQYLSALLLTLPCATADSELKVENLRERPYAEMTLAWLRRQGIQFTHRTEGAVDIYQIKGRQHYQRFTATIPNDFSSASYLLAAAVLLPGVVVLDGLNMTDLQGDKQLITILRAMGADISECPSGLVIHGGQPLRGLRIDASDIPDLLPTLAVIGTYASGRTEIYNVAHARIKETDRINSMTAGLQRLGARLETHADGLTVYQSTLTGAHINGYDDHRTVMALSIAGLLATGTTIISTGEALQKTFPTFVETLRTLGARIERQVDAPA